jgi:hypothetical protein
MDDPDIRDGEMPDEMVSIIKTLLHVDIYSPDRY